MPGLQSVSFTQPTDYSVDLASIERQRALANALMTQSQEPQGTQMAGGWAIPTPATQSIANSLKGVLGAFQGKALDQKEKDVADKYKSDLAAALVNAQQAASPHPENVDTSGERTGSMAMSGSANPPQAMVPGSREKMIQALMSHPATQQLALQQMGQDLQMQGFMNAGQQGMTPGNPMIPGGSGSSVMAGGGSQIPQGVPPQAFGGPAGGSPMAVWLRSDPSGKSYLEALARDYTEANKPQNVRPEGTIAVPDGKGGYRQAYYSAKVGEGMTRDPGGTASIIPGYLEGQAAAGRTPLTQVTNADQTHSYIPNAQLAGAANASPIPQAPARPASPANFPRETPAENTAAMQRRLGVLNNELATEQAKLADPKISPEDRDNASRNIAAIQKEIAGTPGGRSPQAPSGPPRFGQTQEEQIRQSRETAAGKAVDEQFAKDYVSFTTGGAQDAAKQISQLADVKKALETPGADLTGPVRGKIPDSVQGFTATGQKAIAMRERVEEVVQRSLRAILGAQFTEKEGERLIARAYNPSLPEAENSIRVSRLLTQLQQAYQNKQSAADYFQKNNTLQGWQGKLPSMSDFDPEAQTSGGKIGTPQRRATDGAKTVNWSDLK